MGNLVVLSPFLLTFYSQNCIPSIHTDTYTSFTLKRCECSSYMWTEMWWKMKNRKKKEELAAQDVAGCFSMALYSLFLGHWWKICVLGQGCTSGHLHTAKTIWNCSVQGATRNVGRAGLVSPGVAGSPCVLLKAIPSRRPQNQIYYVVCNKPIITHWRETLFAQGWMLGGFP